MTYDSNLEDKKWSVPIHRQKTMEYYVWYFILSSATTVTPSYMVSIDEGSVKGSLLLDIHTFKCGHYKFNKQYLVFYIFLTLCMPVVLKFYKACKIILKSGV